MPWSSCLLQNTHFVPMTLAPYGHSSRVQTSLRVKLFNSSCMTFIQSGSWRASSTLVGSKPETGPYLETSERQHDYLGVRLRLSCMSSLRWYTWKKIVWRANMEKTARRNIMTIYEDWRILKLWLSLIHDRVEELLSCSIQVKGCGLDGSFDGLT